MSAPTTDELVGAMDQLHGVGNAVKLEFLRLLDRIDSSEGWREDGAPSLENWVAFRYAMTWRAAVDHVNVMRALRHLPAVASAFGTGGISWEVLAMLCTFVEPGEDEKWADRAQKINAAQVRRWAGAARELKREHAARVQGERSLTVSWDGSSDFLRLRGVIPGAEGALVKKALDRIADELGPGPDGVFTTIEQRRADALVELAATRIADDHDPDRATVSVHIDARELGSLDGKGFIGDTALPAEVVRRLSCDARIEIVAHAPGGDVVGVGRVSRTVPPWMRRRLQERDGGCMVCGRSTGTHAHHVEHWARGGRTDLDNLVLLCRRCHRLVHDCGFRLVRNAAGHVRLVRPDGRPVRNRPAPLRPEVRERLLGPTRAPRVPMRC